MFINNTISDKPDISGIRNDNSYTIPSNDNPLPEEEIGDLHNTGFDRPDDGINPLPGGGDITPNLAGKYEDVPFGKGRGDDDGGAPPPAGACSFVYEEEETEEKVGSFE